ncbi:MAG: GNAT family N-acetyltransferase [Anaerolineae bacterium]|nr:GNAT family N-acetyltransferase [Anaerolineae bacterium]
MSTEYVLRQLDMPKDAVKLSEMWLASDEQWPGTWSGGTEITPHMVTEWHEREQLIDVWVYEADDQIVAYCSFNTLQEQKDAGYVALLNVHPEYQGRSLGRRLLQRCLERCSELGLTLLTLGTWSGNLKSVPLYKKTGFYWVPDTSVWMLNFVPSILSLPCAQPFFARHDWYATFVRDLVQDEDDERWEGMKVFTYRWEADGEALTAWADREARKITAVETDAFFAGAIADNIEPAKGMSTPIRWRITNKRDRPMSVSLVAAGTEHMRLDHRAAFQLGPGETRALEATVQIARDAPDPKQDKPVPSVRTLLVLDGEVLELGTGLRPRPAIAVSTEPRYVTLFPGVPKRVHLAFRSHLPEEVEATVRLAPEAGLGLDWREQRVSVPGKGFAGASVTLSADKGGVYPLYVSFGLPGGSTVAERLPVFCLPAGGLLADRGAKETRLENEWTRLILTPRAGEMVFQARQHDDRLGNQRARVGPPFWPSELDDYEFDIELRQSEGRVTATMTADMQSYEGIRLYREVSLGAGPLIEVSHALLNRGAATHKLQISTSVDHWHDEDATITVPLASGLVSSPRPEFPAAEEDISKHPEGLAERWIALESPHGTLGIVWDDDIIEQEVHWGNILLTKPQTCAPQQWARYGRQFLYVGPGDWRTVQHHARRLCGTEDRDEPIPAHTRAIHDVHIEPMPLVTIDDTVTATLAVDNLRRRPMEGQMELVLPAGVRADRTLLSFENVALGRVAEQQIVLQLPPDVGVHEARALLHTQLADGEATLPIIRLGRPGEVRVTHADADGRSVHVIDNGQAQFSVAPGFCGAVTAWMEDGVNHLRSPFPEVKTFAWMSPWYGGVTPLALKPRAWDMPGKLYQESFHAQAVDAPDARGIPWQGIRLEGLLTREELVGLAVELDYLTLPGSNLLKLDYRVRNLTTAPRAMNVGWFVFAQPGASAGEHTLRGAAIERKDTPWESWSIAGEWAMVTNPQDGRTMSMISPYPRVWMMDWGRAAGFLAWMDTVDLLPSGSTQRTCCLALCPDPESARRYAWLAKAL